MKRQLFWSLLSAFVVVFFLACCSNENEPAIPTEDDDPEDPIEYAWFPYGIIDYITKIGYTRQSNGKISLTLEGTMGPWRNHIDIFQKMVDNYYGYEGVDLSKVEGDSVLLPGSETPAYIPALMISRTIVKPFLKFEAIMLTDFDDEYRKGSDVTDILEAQIQNYDFMLEPGGEWDITPLIPLNDYASSTPYLKYHTIALVFTREPTALPEKTPGKFLFKIHCPDQVFCDTVTFYR